jgi:hypothetical protein
LKPLDPTSIFVQIVAVNRETIKENLRGAGSFLIRTSDGKEYPVPHPEFVMIGRFNVVVEGRKGGISILDPLHIVAIFPVEKRSRSKAA